MSPGADRRHFNRPFVLYRNFVEMRKFGAKLEVFESQYRSPDGPTDMALLNKRRYRLLPVSLIVSLLFFGIPVLDGCSRGGEQSAPAPSPQSSTAAPAAPAVQAPPSTMAPSPVPTVNPAAMQPGPAPGGATAQQLQELVAPIALYPDMLIAQILAASTYPTQVVEADRFMKQNPNLSGDALAAQINPQWWDPSIKSLCQFPSVLKTMSDSLAWTSALGEAYYNQPNDVMAAIQVMRKRAMDAGTLKSTPQQKVEVQTASAPPSETAPAQGGVQQPAQQQVVVIQPAQPNTVYVPTYNPTTAYGAPVAQPPGYSGTDVLAAGVLGFGAGVLLGSLVNNGNNNWGCNWYGGYGGYGGNVVYNRNVWVSNSNIVAGRWGNAGYRPGYPGYRPAYPGYRPGAPGYRPGYPGGNPRPMPYSGRGQQFAGNNPNLRPNFPKPETLPNRPGNSNRPGGNRGANRPGGNVGGNRPGGNLGGGRLGGNPGGNRPGNVGSNRPGGNFGSNRPGNLGGGNLAANRPQRPSTRPANNPMRGYGGGGAAGANRGGRGGGAFGGVQPGGFAQAASNRGRNSFGGGGGFGGGKGFGGGGGGRGFGGGGGRRGGGGGGRRR
jgi:hypothetical protein